MPWIKLPACFFRKPKNFRPDAPTDDEIMAMVASRAFMSGNIVMGERREDGSVEVSEIPTADPDRG